MNANHNKQEAECQTLLQCSPHILTQEEIATVQSDAVCQTLVSCDPKTLNSELYPLLSYFDPKEIQRDAVSELYLPRVRKLQFTLPEWHIDSMQVSREQLRKAKDDDQTTDEENAEGSAHSAACDELQALREEGMGGGSEEAETAEEVIIAVPNENISGSTAPASACEEFIALGKEKEAEQNVRDVSKESVRNSAEQDGLQIQSILKRYRDDETMRKKRRKVKSSDADCQTDLMVAPHILLPFERAVVSCELSVQTSVTCHPTCSVSDILPKLRSYIEHEGRHAEPTSGDNRNNASVLDLLKGLIDEVENSHQHMFDPGYRPLVVPRELTEFKHDTIKPKLVKFSDVTNAKVKQEKPEPPSGVTYPVVKQEPPSGAPYPVVKQEPPSGVTYPVVKQEPPSGAPYPVVKQEPPDGAPYPVVKQEPPDGALYPIIKQEPPDDDVTFYSLTEQEMPVNRMDDSTIDPEFHSLLSVKEETPSEDGSDLSITGVYDHSNIIAHIDLTEDDFSEVLPDEVKQIISDLIDNAVRISKPEIQASKPTRDLIPNYNINIFVNNFMTPLTDATQKLADAAIKLNIMQSNQLQPSGKSSKQITDENVRIHQVIYADKPGHSDTQNVERLSSLDLVIKCTTVFGEQSERPQQSTANLSKQLRKSKEDGVNLNREKSKVPCAAKQQSQLSKTRPCSAEIVPSTSESPESLSSESVIQYLLQIDSPSIPSSSIETVQPTTSNIRENMRSCSECSVSLKETLLKEIEYPTTTSQENLACLANICDNVGLQNCPTRNVRSISQIPTTDKSSHQENVQSSSTTKNKRPAEENICRVCPCHVQDPSEKMLSSTNRKINHEKFIAPQTIVSTTITITSNASKPKVMSRQISTTTTTNLTEQAKPSEHVSFHKNYIEGSDQLARADDLFSKQDKQKSEEQVSPSNMLCEVISEGNYIEPYMEELADEYEISPFDDEVVTLFPEKNKNNNNLVYNNSCTSCDIETYIAVGYAADSNVKDQIAFAPSKSILQLKEKILDRRDSKSELPWNLVHLQPNIKISYVEKEKSETDLNNEEEVQEESPPLLSIPSTNSMLFNQACDNNEPYAKKLANEFSVEERTSEHEIEWDKIILSRPTRIRKANEPRLEKEVNEVASSKSLPCICKSGCVIPVRVHRNIDLLCRNRASSKNEIACIPHGDSKSTIVILLPRSRHFISTKFPVEPATSSSSIKTKNEPVEEPLKSILSEKELRTVTSKKSVTFTDPKTKHSKNKTKLVPSRSESSFRPCTCNSVTSKSTIPVVPVIRKAPSQQSRTAKILIDLSISKSHDSNKRSTPQTLTPVPTKEKIDDKSKIHCVNSSVSTASLKSKPDRVFMAMSACETEFKPIKQALNNVQEKLRNLNMPELDCIFNKEPAYTSTLPTGDKEKFNISVGYKLDQSNQRSFKYNGMNSNGMNNQYNTFSGIGSSNVSPALKYSQTTNVYPSHTSMPYHQIEMYHSYRAPEPSNIPRYPRQHQNYYSLPDSEWPGTNYGNNIDFPSPAESTASKYSFRNFDQDDYNEEFSSNSYIPDYIPSQYSVCNSGKQESERKGRPKDKEFSSGHNYNRDSIHVPDSFPYFDDDAESSYVHRKNYGNSDKHSHESSKSRKRCDCKKPHKTSSSKIKSNKKKQRRPSKTEMETTDSQCALFDVIKSLFMPPDRKHSNKNTPRLTSKDIENLRVHMQFHSKKDKHKHN